MLISFSVLGSGLELWHHLNVKKYLIFSRNALQLLELVDTP